jgi:hypothetical protein
MGNSSGDGGAESVDCGIVSINSSVGSVGGSTVGVGGGGASARTGDMENIFVGIEFNKSAKMKMVVSNFFMIRYLVL